MSDISFREKVGRRNNGLGFVKEGTIGVAKVVHMFRVIEFKQLSTYVIEEVESHIHKANELQH
jgi:hypothetical protein